MKFQELARTALSVVLVTSLCFPAGALASTQSDSSGSDDGDEIQIVETETKTVTDEEAAEALETGVEGMPSTSESADDDDAAEDEISYDVEALLESLSDSDELSTQSSRTIRLESYSGTNRYETAVAVAEAAYPDGVDSETAIVVSGSSSAWPDTLSASSLAGMLDCPILYTSSSELTSVTKAALKDLGVDTVIIIGGTGVVSSSVEKSLASVCTNVTRLSGSTRYETQVAIYEYGAQVGEWSSNVIVTSGTSYADALSVSSIAFAECMPIFLCKSGDVLTAEQLTVLLESNAETFTILGGYSAVTSVMEGFLVGVNSATTGSYDSSCVERVYGSNRYETSWEIALWGVENGYVKWKYTGLANGTSSVDALCASVLQGKTGSPILLITDDRLENIEELAEHSPSYARVFGGTGVISALSRNAIAEALGYKYTEIEGFKIYVDAGHGTNNTGNGVWDSGATGNGYYEANLTKELATMVAEQLEEDGYDVFLNDDGGPYYYRHAEAIAQDCNVIISIHFNAGGGSGSMTLIHSSNADEYSEYVAEIMQEYLVAGTSLKDLGVRKQAVAILSGELPACLLEVAFIDNSSDMSTYQSRKSTVAAKIVAGIESL